MSHFWRAESGRPEGRVCVPAASAGACGKTFLGYFYGEQLVLLMMAVVG